MSLYSILDISAAGMEAQQTRLAAAAANLANAQTTARPGQPVYTPLTVVLRSAGVEDAPSNDPAQWLPRPVAADPVPMNVAPRLVYDPGHPDADARGFVTRPGVDPVTSMLDLMTISRSYEANLRAFDITRTLLQKTLDVENHS